MRIEGINLNGIRVINSNPSPRGTLENPGISAQDILDSGQTTSDWYYIQTSTMASPLQVYCNMSDQSGGWMLIAYSPDLTAGGALNTPDDGLDYPNTWENGQGTLNKMRVSTMDLWFHNGSAQCTQVMKMASTTASRTPLLANMTIANKVVYDNPSNLLLTTATVDGIHAVTFVNNTPMTGTWSPIKGHTLMTTPLAVNAPGDWLLNFVTWTVCGPSTDLEATGRSGLGQGTASFSSIPEKNVYGVKNVAATTSSFRSDIKSYAVYIK